MIKKNLDYAAVLVILGAIIFVLTQAIRYTIVARKLTNAEVESVHTPHGVKLNIPMNVVIKRAKSLDSDTFDVSGDRVCGISRKGSISPDWNIDDHGYDVIIKRRNRHLSKKDRWLIISAVNKYSKLYNIHVKYTYALIDIESSFRKTVVSNKNAVGLMQINWKVWGAVLRKAGIANQYQELYVPDINVNAGLYILRHYLKEAKRKGVEKELKYAITRYNGGHINKHYVRLLGKVYAHNRIGCRLSSN